MSRKRRDFNEELKKNALPQSNKKSNNKVVEEFQIDQKLLANLYKQYKARRYHCFFADETLTIVDLKQENINLQRLLITVKIERDQLKKAISILSMSENKFTWS